MHIGVIKFLLCGFIVVKHVNHDFPSSDLRKQELDGEEEGKEKNRCFWAMDMEKNAANAMDR